MKTKHAVRAVVLDDDNNTAILSVGNDRLYKIPGGGIEKGESIEEALKREVREEAGCSVEIGEYLGEHEFSIKENNETYHSVNYLAKVVGEKGEPVFSEKEKSWGMSLVWINIDKAIELIENNVPENKYEKIIQDRGLDCLKKARKLIK